ncbi:MAG: hypothetical protein QM579_04315 [Desulfovibrio sp.]|uniref:beta strand repeat-containing protein n=1 Tax=Desulfovibrio sp. TaxID=885 RepID=UPI0039E3F65E
MNTIILAHPTAGQHTTVKAIPGSRLSMDFVLEEATVERQGENLVFVFDDGSSILIEDFYVDFTGENLPEFEVGGQIVSGSDFFASLGPDLAPAAGPEAARSARYNEMGNADLASGIDHLDGLDMSIPGSAVSMENQLTAPLMNLGTVNNSGPVSGEGPTGPPTVPPIGQSFAADVRAVMYNTGPNSADHVVTTPIFFKNADGSVVNLAGAPAGSYAVAWSFPADWDNSWLADPVVENGQLVFKLSPQGLQMLQQTGDDSFLRGFVTVTVTMNGQTSEYKVEVVGTQGTYFNSADYDEEYGAVSGLGTDYIGEYHQGSGQNGSYHITSSSKNNDIVLNDSLIGGSYVHASGNPSDMGHDFNTILMNKGVINTGGATAVTSYDGTLRVHDGVSAEGGNASNSIDMGKGQIHISNTSGHGVSASQGSNTISGNQVLVEGSGTGVYAENGGQNSIINTGDKTLTITGGDEGVYATGPGSSNHISNLQGTVNITGQTLEGLAATGNGANYVFGKDVNITGASGQTLPGGGISGAAGIFASGGSINEVTAMNGDVTVKGHRGMEAVTGGSNDVSVEGLGNITVEGEIFGAGALNLSSNNILTAEQGTVTVSASDGSALVAADGSNEVTGRDVNISGSSSGLNAAGVGSNTVTGTGGSITIKGDSSAVYASANTGGAAHVGNTIIGEGDTAITITGGIVGMDAADGGRNEVSGKGNNVITVTGEWNGMSADGRLSANSIVAVDGTVNVTGQIGEGLSATRNGANYIIGKNVNIAGASGETLPGGGISGAAGIFASGGSINEVTAMDGDVTVKGHRGMEAVTGGSNDVSVMGQGNITVEGELFGAGALNQSSNNALTAEQGTVTVTASNGSALVAADGSNEVTGRDVNISGSSSGLNAAGVGSNTVTGTGGSITIKGDSSAVYASANTGGAAHVGNTIIGQGDTSITIEGGIAGMDAAGGGRNEVSGKGNNVITVTGNLDGMSADGALSANSIVTVGGTVNVTGQDGEGLSATRNGANYIIGKNVNIAGASGETLPGGGISGAAGIFASGGSINEVTAMNGDVTVAGHRGLEAISGGSNDVSVEGQGNITVTGQQFGAGALNQSSNNKLTAEQGTVTVTASNGSALLAADGSNEVTGRDVNISGSSSGLNASGVGSNTVTGTGGDITISGKSSGVNASANTTNIDVNNSITAQGDGNITISGGNAGMNASGGGRNSISGKGNNIITVTSDLDGMSADGFLSANSITAVNGTVNVSGQYGLSATSGGANYIIGKNIDIAGARQEASPTGPPTEGAGLFVSNGGDNQITATDGGTIHIAGSRGMDVTGHGINDVSIDGHGSINVEGELYGMQANGASSVNSISLDSGSVSVTANHAAGITNYATAMSALNGGHNEISSDGSVTVSITATAAAAGNAIAMWAKGGGSLNIINGGQNSSVSITAQDGQGTALSANTGGRNEISLGAGSQITIQGNITTDANAASENKIVISGSDNTVTVAGSVALGSLNIVANADNTFTLILQASDMNEFASRYADWLNGLTNADFFAGLTSVQFQIDGEWSGADEAALRDALSDFLSKVDGDKVSFTSPSDAQPEPFSVVSDALQDHDAPGHNDPGHDGAGSHDSGDGIDPLHHDFDSDAYSTLLFASDGGDFLDADESLYDDAMDANYSETGIWDASSTERAGLDSHEGYNTPGQSLVEMDDILREGDDSLDSVLQPASATEETIGGHMVDARDLVDLTNTAALKEAALPVASVAQSRDSSGEDSGARVSEQETLSADVSGEVARQMVENA